MSRHLLELACLISFITCGVAGSCVDDTCMNDHLAFLQTGTPHTQPAPSVQGEAIKAEAFKDLLRYVPTQLPRFPASDAYVDHVRLMADVPLLEPMAQASRQTPESILRESQSSMRTIQDELRKVERQQSLSALISHVERVARDPELQKTLQHEEMNRPEGEQGSAAAMRVATILLPKIFPQDGHTGRSTASLFQRRAVPAHHRGSVQHDEGEGEAGDEEQPPHDEEQPPHGAHDEEDPNTFVVRTADEVLDVERLGKERVQKVPPPPYVQGYIRVQAQLALKMQFQGGRPDPGNHLPHVSVICEVGLVYVKPGLKSFFYQGRQFLSFVRRPFLVLKLFVGVRFKDWDLGVTLFFPTSARVGKAIHDEKFGFEIGFFYKRMNKGVKDDSNWSNENFKLFADFAYGPAMKGNPRGEMWNYVDPRAELMALFEWCLNVPAKIVPQKFVEELNNEKLSFNVGGILRIAVGRNLFGASGKKEKLPFMQRKVFGALAPLNDFVRKNFQHYNKDVKEDNIPEPKNKKDQVYFYFKAAGTKLIPMEGYVPPTLVGAVGMLFDMNRDVNNIARELLDNDIVEHLRQADMNLQNENLVKIFEELRSLNGNIVRFIDAAPTEETHDPALLEDLGQ